MIEFDPIERGQRIIKAFYCELGSSKKEDVKYERKKLYVSKNDNDYFISAHITEDIKIGKYFFNKPRYFPIVQFQVKKNGYSFHYSSSNKEDIEKIKNIIDLGYSSFIENRYKLYEESLNSFIC